MGSLYNTILGNNVPIFKDRFPFASRIEPVISNCRVCDGVHLLIHSGQSGASPSSNISAHSVVYF